MVDIVTKLLKKPRKPKRSEVYTIDTYEKNLSQQADLLYLPNDNGYKYLLVVVDVGTRLMDALPLKSKDAKAIETGFKKIYSGSILKIPKNIAFDSGSEFKGEVKDYFEKKGVFVKVGKVARHKQSALVENRNKQISVDLFKRMHQEEFITDETSTEWVDLLPEVIKKINKNAKKLVKKIVKKEKKTKTPKHINIAFIEGDHVRVKLEQPIDAVTGKPHGGRFRATDLRYAPEVRTVKNVIMNDGKPPLYILNAPGKKDKTENVGYSGYELQLVEKDENYGDHKKILLKKKPTKFIAERILDKKKVKGKTMYHVKWRGYDETSWEERKSFLENPHSASIAERFES